MEYITEKERRWSMYSWREIIGEAVEDSCIYESKIDEKISKNYGETQKESMEWLLPPEGKNKDKWSDREVMHLWK